MTLTYIISLLIKYKYAVIIPMLMVEAPGVAILASFLASPKGGLIFNIWVVFLVVVLVDIFADTIYYLIGRFAKDRLLARYPKKFSVSPEKFSHIESFFERHTLKTLIIGKFSHTLGWPTMVAAGSAKVPYKQFFAINSSVSFVKSAIFIFLGYYFGVYYDQIIQYLGQIGIIASVLMVGLIIYFIYSSVSSS